MSHTPPFGQGSLWAQHLMAPVTAQQAGLSPAEALRVQRLHDRLLAAVQAHDRPALRSTQQEVLQAAFTPAGTPALRSALRALVWRMVFNSQFGLLNTTFHTDINWLGKNPYAWITIFVLVLWAGIGGNLVIYRSALSGVDESLYEAAKVDGAGPVRIFFSITLPEIKLPLFYTTIMTTTGAFNVWGQPVMLTNGGPNYQTQVLLMDIRNLAFPAGPAAAGMASAMALLLGIILMAIAAIQLIFMNKED